MVIVLIGIGALLCRRRPAGRVSLGPATGRDPAAR